MPLLALTKRRVAERIGSEALRGDAASSLTCGYMAATVLVGLGLDALLGWWWAEDFAALAFLAWLIGETRCPGYGPGEKPVSAPPTAHAVFCANRKIAEAWTPVVTSPLSWHAH